MDRRTLIKLISTIPISLSLPGCTQPIQNNTLYAPGMPQPTMFNTNGIRMGVYSAGTGVPVVFCHGFPELAFSWRHQFHSVIKAGFHAVAPDLRGYGLTDKPTEIKDYTVGAICDDLVGMLDQMGLKKAVFCGHDWGGYIVDTMPLLYPERCLGIIGIGAHNNQRPPNLPYPNLARNELLDKEAFNDLIQLPKTEKFLNQHAKEFFSLLFRKDYLTADSMRALPETAPERKFDLVQMISNASPSEELFISSEDLRYYTKIFGATGFAGGINWYRAISSTIEEFSTRKKHWGVNVPYLYIWPEQDPINQDGLEVDMQAYIPDLEQVKLGNCGHFAMEEKPEELSSYITEWLQKKFFVNA